MNYLKIIGEHIDYNFEGASEEDIKDTVAWLNRREVSDATKCDTRTILKRFYKWIGNGEYPDKVKWINTTLKRSNNTLLKDMLTEEDVQKLMEAAYNTRDKAIISILWETEARIGELIDLKIGDLEDHDHGKKVIIKGKTGPRRVPLISSVPHIQAWLSNHPRGEDRGAPLWVNIGTWNLGEKMKYRSITKALNVIGERAGVDKPVNPHHFRHSRATYLANRFTEAQLCVWFGWVQGNKMPAKYVHLSGRDIDADYARIHGIQDRQNPEESQLAPNECPRCDAKNAPTAKFCQNCGQALATEAYEEIEGGKKWIETLENQEVEAEGSLDNILEQMVEKKIEQMK